MKLNYFIASAVVLSLPGNAQEVQSETATAMEEFVTWQESPNGRGTMDIIWSCLFTVFICVWTAVHLNVPAPTETDTTVDLWIRRIKWGWCFTLMMLRKLIRSSW